MSATPRLQETTCWVGFGTMGEWDISPWGGVAYLDLRGEELTFSEAERLIEVVQPYFPSRRLPRIIIGVRGLDPPPGPVEALVAGVEAQARTHDVRVQLRRDEPAV
jgi:hypothetical protein